MKKILTILSMLVPIAAVGSESSLVVIAFNDRPAVSVVVRQEADFVSVPVTVASERKGPAERFAEMRSARQALIDKARGNAGVVVHEGPISLSARRNAKSAFSSSYSAPSRAQLILLVPFKTEGKDVFTAATDVQKLVESVEPPGEAHYELGDVQLAVDNPEKARPQLLRAIAQDVAKMKDLIGPVAKVTVSGLEGPVLVRQINDREVELFVDYSLAVELK